MTTGTAGNRPGSAESTSGTDRTRRFLADEIEELKRQNTLPAAARAQCPQAAEVRGRRQGRLINLSSNNYLGLATHPKSRKRLSGDPRLRCRSGAVRTIAGDMTNPRAPRDRLGAFKRTEAVTSPSSGLHREHWRHPGRDRGISLNTGGTKNMSE